MVGQKVGDPGWGELDRRMSKLPQQLTSDLHKLVRFNDIAGVGRVNEWLGSEIVAPFNIITLIISAWVIKYVSYTANPITNGRAIDSIDGGFSDYDVAYVGRFVGRDAGGFWTKYGGEVVGGSPEADVIVGGFDFNSE